MGIDIKKVMEFTGLNKEKATELITSIGGDVKKAIAKHLRSQDIPTTELTNNPLLTDNVPRSLQGATTPTQGTGKNILLLVAGQLQNDPVDHAEGAFYLNLCQIYKVATTSNSVDPANVYIVSVKNVAAEVDKLQAVSTIDGVVCDKLHSDIENVHKIQASGAEFSKEVFKVIKKKESANDRLMVVMLSHGRYGQTSSDGDVPEETMNINAGYHKVPMDVKDLREAINANQYKSVVFAADFCYSSMIALDATKKMNDALIKAISSSDGIAITVGENTELQEQFCTCKGDGGSEKIVLKSNVLFIGQPKYLEAWGNTEYIPTALSAMLGKCAEKVNLGGLFELGDKSTEEIEKFRKCLPFKYSHLDEHRCHNPDVCIYKGKEQ